MNIWYLDIPAGEYTTRQIIEMSNPKQTYNCVYLMLYRLKVEAYKPGTRNERIWKWKGADYYLKKPKEEKK